MEGDISFDGDGDDSLVVPSEFHEYLKGMDMEDIQPIQSTSPVHRARSFQSGMSKPVIHQSNAIYRTQSAENLSMRSNEEVSLSSQSSHNKSLDDFKAKAKRKGIVPLPSVSINLEEELKARQLTILRLQKQNEELRAKVENSYEGSCKDDFLNQIETISKLKLDCVLKQNEVDRLKAVEVTLKQTKQVLKDTTWALTVREEELKNIKADMRDNYESRLNELILRLNDRELKLTSMKNERDGLSEKSRDLTLRVDELTQQISCYEQELDAKNKQFELKEAEIKALKTEKHQISVESTTKIESLMERLRDMEKKVNENVSSVCVDNLLLDESITENVAAQHDSVEILLPDTGQNAHQPLNIQHKLVTGHPDADAMSLEQITLMIQDNANLRLVVEESKEKLQLYTQDSENEKKELQKEVAAKGDQINELMQLVNTMQSQIPLSDNVEVYSSAIDQEQDDEDEVRSCGSDDEGTASMKQQMSHVISNYEKRINELQSLYDQDVFSLENDNKRLKKEVKELQSNYLNVSHSNNSFALDFEDMKTTYDEKIDSLKSHYEDLLHKECVSAQKQQTELLAENNTLQLIVEEAEKKFMQHLEHMKENFNSNYQTDLTSELQKIFAKQTSSISAIKEDLQRELNDIKSMHCEDLCTVEQQFGIHEMNKSGLEDTYSNEILKLTEERNIAQNTTQILKDELGVVQQEYDSLKELYDSLAFDVGQYKNEKLQLLSQISVLSEQSSNLKSSLRTRRNEVEEYKTKINDASKTIEDYTKKLIGRSEKSSNASDSLKSELEDLSLDISSSMVPVNRTMEIQKKSNALSVQVKLLRSNLDEAKSELKNLYEEHGLSTAVYDRLTNILNLLKKYIESDILEQEMEFAVDGEEDGDKDIPIGDHSLPKLVFDDGLKGSKDKVKALDTLCDVINQSNTFEISENLSLDDDDLSDTTVNSDNPFTQQDFEKELRDLKIDIPLDYCNSTLKQNLNKESKDDSSSSQKFELEILNLRKENALLQQKIDSLSSGNIDGNIALSSVHGLTSDIFIEEDTSTFSDGKLLTLKTFLENVFIFEGNDASGFKKCEKNNVTENILNNLKSTLDMVHQENIAFKEELLKQSSENILPAFNHEIFDDEFDWEQSAIIDPDKNSPKQMDSEGHTLKQRDSFSKSISDLEMENENLKRENVSLKEDAERDCKAIIGPGFTSEILYYEHAQPVDGDSVGIKVDAIKTLLSNVVISQGNEAVSFHEYEGRDVILRLLLDIQVEVVDLIKENNVLKEETVKQKPCAVTSCSVQTGDSIAEDVAIDEKSDSVIDLSLNNSLILDRSDTSSLAEQELLESDINDKIKHNFNKEKNQTVNMPSLISEHVSSTCSTILEEQTLCEDTKNGNVCVKEIDEVDIVSKQNEDAMFTVKRFDLDQEKLEPEFTSTVKDIHDCEIVNLGEENAHIMVKIKQKKKKVVLPGFSSVYFSSDHAQNIITNIVDPPQIPLSKSDLKTGDAVTINKDILVPGYSSEILCSDMDVNNALEQASETLVTETVNGSIADNNLENKNQNNTMKVDVQNKPILVPGFSSEILFNDLIPSSDIDATLSNKMSTIKMLLENVIIFEGNENIGFKKTHDQIDFTEKMFNDFEVDVSKIQKENVTLKNEIEKVRMGLQIPAGFSRARIDSQDSLDRSLDVEDLVNVYSEHSTLNFQQTLASNVTSEISEGLLKESNANDVQRNNVSMIPGFSSDVLLQEQSITSAVDVGSKDDALNMLIDNLIIFEGNEEIGFKTSDGNDLTKSFLNECQGQLVKLRKENTALKSQIYPQSRDRIANQSDVMDTSIQQGLLGEILNYTQHAVNACTKDEICTGETDKTHIDQQEFDDLRKENADLQEKVQKQQSFIVPGFSSEILHNESISSLYDCSTDTTNVDDLALLLENVVIFEGNEVLGFTKSEENDIAKRLLNDFKTKIVDLLSENDSLKGKVGKMQAICDSRVNDEVINIEEVQPTFSGLELDDTAEMCIELTNLREENEIIKKELEKQCSILVPGFSSELILSEDILPFSEVDSLTRKLDALRKLLESIVIFKGNEKIGYVKYNDVNLSLQLLNDFEIELTEMKKENFRIKEHLQDLSVPDFSREYSHDSVKQITLPPRFSTETDNQENPIPCDSLDAVIMPYEEGSCNEWDNSQNRNPQLESVGGSFILQKPNFVPGFSSEMLYSETTHTVIHPAKYHHLQSELANLQKENTVLKNIKQGSVDSQISVQCEEMHEKSQYANGTRNELIDLLLTKDKVLDSLIGEQSKGKIERDHDDSVGAEYEESLRMSKAWMEAVNIQSLSQLREDLDEDYLERIKIVEEKLLEVYRLRIRKVAATCDQKVTQMKKDYDEEIMKLQQSPHFLEETEATLESYRDSSAESLATYSKDDTRDDGDGDMEMAEDELDSCLEMDGVTKPTKKQQKSLSDKCVNTVSSFGMDTESDIEQKEIIMLKESIIELFRKPEVDNEDVNILFRLDDVEDILQENYAKITDMTDKLKEKLYSVEKEMVDNFNNTIHEKEKKFIEQKNELIIKTKNNVLHDIACVFTELINEHMVFVDGKVENILTEHGKDINVLLQAIESIVVQVGETVMSGQEKGDIPEKVVNKIEQFFQTEKNILGVLKSDEDIPAAHMDGHKRHDDDDDITSEKLKIDATSDENAIGISIWKKFFKDEDSLPKEIQTELVNKKVEFKSSIEKDLNILINYINTSFAKVFGQFAQYNDLKTKHKETKIEAEMINSLASAHTDMVLKNSLENAKNKDFGKYAENDMLRKVGELLLKQMDPEKGSEYKLQYETLLEQYNCEIPVENEIEKLTKEQFDKEIDNVTRLCVYNAVQALFEKEGDPKSALLSFDQVDDGKKVRFMNKFDDVQSTNGDEITRLNNLHKKELEELRQQIDLKVAKKVKQATDDKLSEFDSAKMDLVKQHQFILDEFIAEQEKEIEEIRKEHGIELEKLKSGYVEQIYDLQKLQEMDQDVSICKVDEEDIKAKFQEQLEALKKQHSDDLSKQNEIIRLQFEEEHIGNLNKLQKQIEDDHAEHLRLLSDCQQKQIIEIQDLKNQHETYVQVFQIDHSHEIEKLNKEISNIEDQCARIRGVILEDKEALEGLRSVIQDGGKDDEKDSPSSTSVCDPQDSISTSIINCYKETQNHVKEQYNSQVDTLLNLFDSVLENISSEISLAADPSSSEILLTERVSTKQSVEDLLNAEVTIKPIVHNQIENVFKELKTEYEKWYAGINVEMERLTQKINQLEVNGEVEKGCIETEAKLQRLQRQEEESSNFINILHSDIKKITDERDTFTEEIALLKQNSREIVETIIKSEELLHEKLDEIIDNQLSGLDLSQYGLDTTSHSIQGKDVGDVSLVEMPIKLAAVEEEPDFEPEFMKGVSTRFSETVDHFLQVLSLVFDFKNTSMQQTADMETFETTYEEREVQTEENRLKDVVEKQQIFITELEVEVNKNHDITKEIVAIRESINEKDNVISNLEKICSDQTDIIASIKAYMREQGTEIEALKCAINDQQGATDKLKEQLIKKQMLMDAKECQLIEMEEQLKKENQKHLTERERAYDDQIAIKHSLEERSKEVKDLKDSLESKQVLICELEEKLNSHQLLHDSKEKQCTNVEEELSKQKEKYELEYKKLASDKGKEISAIFNELEETLKEKDKLEDLVKIQEASTLKLTEELNKFDILSNTKEANMIENEERLRKEVAKLTLDLENVTSNKNNELGNIQSALDESTVEKSMLQAEVSKHQDDIQKLEDKHQSDCEKFEEQINKCKVLIDERQAQLERVEEKLMKERENNTLDLKNTTSNKLKEITSIQNALEESITEKRILEDAASKHKVELIQHQVLIDEKETQLTRLQEQLTKSTEKHALDLKELYADKGKEISAIFNELEETLKEKDTMEDLVNNQETTILKLQEQLDKRDLLHDTKDTRMSEREELLKKEITKLQLDLGKMASSLERTTTERNDLENLVNKHNSDIGKREQYLKQCHTLVDEKQSECARLKEQLAREREKHVFDLDNLTATKNEELANTQIALQEISKQKDEVEDLVNLKQAYISKLEEQLKESKVLIDEKVALLTGVEEQLAKETEQYALNLKNLSANKMEELNEEKNDLEHIIEKQLADIGELDKQKRECKSQIDEKQTQLTKIEDELMKERKKHSVELENLSKEKTNEIMALQNELEKKLKEKDELKDIIKKQFAGIVELQGQVSELEKQLIEEKEKHQSDIESFTFHRNEESVATQNIIDQSSREKDLLAEMVDQQHFDISKLEDQLNESKTLLEEKQSELSDVQEQLNGELERSQMNIQDLSMDQTEEINALQSQLDKLQAQLGETEKQHIEEKEIYQSDLLSLTCEQNEKVGALQNSIDEISNEKLQMEDVLNKQQVYIGELEDQLKKSKFFIDEKQIQLDGIEEQLTKEKLRHTLDLGKITKDIEFTVKKKTIENKELNDAIVSQQAIISQLQEEVNQQNILLEETNRQLSDLEMEKENCVSQIETMTYKNEEVMATLQNTLEDQATEKDELEISIENQRALMSQMEAQLTKHKALIDCKESQFAEQAQQLSKQKEMEVANLLNESAELKDMMDSLQVTLEEKVKEEAALGDMIEKEKAFNADLEKQLNEKNEELVALKQQMERETSQHLADLEQISIVKDEMLETIQTTLEDQSKEKAEYEQVIDNQLAIIAGLEEQMSAHKQLNNEKIVLLEERGQLIKSKDKCILDLKKEIEEQVKKMNTIQESLQKEIKEEESKRSVVEESLQQKLIQHSELNEHIIAQQVQMSEVVKKLEEQQDLLSDTSHQLEISRAEIEKISLTKQEDIATIQMEVQRQSTENVDLLKVIEEQYSQISKTELELNESKQLLEAKFNKLAEMKQQEVELTKDLKDSNDRLITIEKTMEEKVKQEADLNELIEKQKSLISELEKQVQELQASLNARNEELAAFKQQMSDEKNQYEEVIQKTLLSQKENTESLQWELEQNSKEKEQLKSAVENQQTFVCELEEQLDKYKDLLESKTRQLRESEQCKAEKEKHILELKKEHNEIKGEVGNFEKMLKEKEQQEIHLNGLIEKQKCFVSELEKKLQEHQSALKDTNSELSKLKQRLSQERNQHMIDYEQAAAKQKETISNMEKVLEEEIKEKKELKNYVESQEALTEELNKQLSEHKLQIASKENLMAEMKSLHAKALKKQNSDFEQTILEKSACISNLEKCLDDEIKKRNELANFVKNQEALIDELERQINDYKIEITQKENHLETMKGEHTKALKTQEALNDEFGRQVGENKITIAQKEDELVKVYDQHAKAFEKLQSDFHNASKEKEHQISMLEKNVTDQIKEADELKNIVKRQQALVCELDEQLNQHKSITSSREREIHELKESIMQRENNEILELKKELVGEQEKLMTVENALQERTHETNEVKEAVMKQQIKVTELEEQLNEQNILLHAKDHELNETKARQVQKWENEKQTLLDTVNKHEEKLMNLEYEMNKKSEELGQLQKSHQEMQLDHINEIMKLTNEHRSQIGTLMEIPQKDRNIKVLLMDLQKEADEVLDLVLNVPDVNENTPAERIETLKATWLEEKEMLLSIIDDMRKNAKESTFTEMSAASNLNLSSEDVEDFAHDEVEESGASIVSDITRDRCDGEHSKNMKHDADRSNMNRFRGHSETSTDPPLVNGHRHIKDAFLHDNGIVSEFEKLLNEESNKVEVLTAKLDEQVKFKESIQMSHEVDLAKVVERELNLKEKYLKVAELLQKEKNAKTRVMEMLNDAQRLNEIQSQNLEEVQNDKNSLLESYTIVSELENLLSKEKEKVDLINAKLEKEKYEKSSIQISLEDEKAELKATKDRENSLKQKCRELNKLLEKETEDKKNIADTLENEKKMISMEKKNLEQKESALNKEMAKLADSNVDEKIKSLKAWEDELKKREKSLVAKEEKLKTLIKRIEQGYDILPQKQAKDSAPEKKDKDDVSSKDNDWLKQIESSELLDTRHLPLVADLNQKIKSLRKEKVKLADTLTELKDEIIDYKKQLKDYQSPDKDNKKKLEDKESKLKALSGAIHPTENIQDTVTTDGQKLLNAGWTIAKVQRLYLKYFRAESFRKALVYQKRYLTLMANENESNIGSVNNWMNVSKRKPSFKVVVLAVISIRRMKYLVKKYHRNLHKSSPEYQYKEKSRNSFKKKSAENVIDELEHSPSGSRRIIENGTIENHVSSNDATRGSTRQPRHSSSIPSKSTSRQPNLSDSKQSHYVPPTTRLTLSEPAGNRLNQNHSNLIEPPNGRLNQTDPPNNRLHVSELTNGTHLDGSHVNNIETYVNRNHVPLPSLPMDNLCSNDGVPRSYPRPSGILTEEVPSRISRTSGDATLSNSRVDKTSYTNRPFSSPPSPLLSSTSRNAHEHKDDANESLTSYIHTLETLQNRLKKVGYNDRTRPPLL